MHDMYGRRDRPASISIQGMEGSVDNTVRQFILAQQVMQTVLGNPQDLSACWDQLLVNT